MRDYHEYEKVFIGSSDVAALIFVECHIDSPMNSTIINFGGDSNYYAYIVDENADIGNHYCKIAEFDHWLKIYDDDGLTYKSPYRRNKHFNIYRSGDYGIIIQIIS